MRFLTETLVVAAVLAAYGIVQALAIASELAGLPPTTEVPRMPLANALGLVGMLLALAAYVFLGRLIAARGGSRGEAAVHGAVAGLIASLIGSVAQALAAREVLVGIGWMYGVASELVTAALIALVALMAAASAGIAALVSYLAATVLRPRAPVTVL